MWLADCVVISDTWPCSGCGHGPRVSAGQRWKRWGRWPLWALMLPLAAAAIRGAGPGDKFDDDEAVLPDVDKPGGGSTLH